MELFEFIILILCFVTLSHTMVSLVMRTLDLPILMTPYELWQYGEKSVIASFILYSIYTVFAPIFGVIGLIVWAIWKEY